LSSTERARLHKFFRSKLVPAAEKLREQRRVFFPQGPDDDAESWYQQPPEDDELFDLDDGWETALKELWVSEDLEALLALVDSLSQLAADLRTRDREQEEVSPFIYVMY